MSMTTKHGTLPRLHRGCSYFHCSAFTSSSAKTRGIHGGVTLTPNSLPHCAQHLPTHRSFCESGPQFQGIKFLGAPRQSSATAMPSLKTRSSELSLPTLAGKTLVCHCLAHEECHADALAQAYESEVMIPSEDFTPAILERNDTGFVTEPHGFSQSADGGGVHSSGDWLAPRAGTSDIFKDLRHAIVSKHGLHNTAMAAWAARRRSPFMQDKHDDYILAATKPFLQSAGLHPNLCVHPNQPFRLGLLRNLLQLMQDSDIGLIVRTKTVLWYLAVLSNL